MSRYLNSPREADWYACPTCGDEVLVGSSGCKKCHSFAESEADSADGLNPADASADFDYDDWKKREFGIASRFKPHYLSWKYWITGILLIIALVWATIFAGFMRH